MYLDVCVFACISMQSCVLLFTHVCLHMHVFVYFYISVYVHMCFVCIHLSIFVYFIFYIFLFYVYQICIFMFICVMLSMYWGQGYVFMYAQNHLRPRWVSVSWCLQTVHWMKLAASSQSTMWGQKLLVISMLGQVTTSSVPLQLR